MFHASGPDPRDRFNSIEGMLPFGLGLVSFAVATIALNVPWRNALFVAIVVCLLGVGVIMAIWTPLLVKYNLLLDSPRERLVRAPCVQADSQDGVPEYSVGEPYLYPKLFFFPPEQVLVFGPLAILILLLGFVYQGIAYLFSRTVQNWRAFVDTSLALIGGVVLFVGLAFLWLVAIPQAVLTVKRRWRLRALRRRGWVGARSRRRVHIDVFRVANCPRCGGSHDYSLTVKRQTIQFKRFGVQDVLAPSNERLLDVTLTLQCPVTGAWYKARVLLDDTSTYNVYSVEREGQRLFPRSSDPA